MSFDHLIAIIEKRPALGWLGALAAAAPPWISAAGEWAKFLGILVGLLAGIFTALIQAGVWLDRVVAWRAKRRAAKRPPSA